MRNRRNGLLVCAGSGDVKNIGDYIQSVAQEQFYDRIDTYVEREDLDVFSSDEKTNVIMNAWFMWNPEHFPPSSSINPLFISMHIVPSIADKMLSPSTVSYLKQYEPIGARDMATKAVLEQYGVQSYFSGCLTLTLGLKYKDDEKDGSIYFVDPYYELGRGKKLFKGYNVLLAFFLLVKYYSHIRPLKDKFVCEFHTRLNNLFPKMDRMLHLASFYDTYSKVFDDEVLCSAHYIRHEVLQSQFHYDNDEKMEYAKYLIRKYAKAKLVVTSRIHCALPCLGIEIPVIFVTSDNLEQGVGRSGSNGRFGGLIELLNLMEWTPSGVKVLTDSLHTSLCKGKISMLTKIRNSKLYKPICDSLIKSVNNYISQK